MPDYRLYVKTAGRWGLVASISAASHREAFGLAMLTLDPANYAKPIRLEQSSMPKVKGKGKSRTAGASKMQSKRKSR